MRFCVDELGSGCKGRDELRAAGRELDCDDARGWLGGAGNVKALGGRALRRLALDDMVPGPMLLSLCNAALWRAGRLVEAAVVKFAVAAVLLVCSWLGPRGRVRTRLLRLEFKLPLRLCPGESVEGEAGFETPWSIVGDVDATRLGFKAGEVVGCASAWSGRKLSGSGKLFGGFEIPPVLEALRRGR